MLSSGVIRKSGTLGGKIQYIGTISSLNGDLGGVIGLVKNEIEKLIQNFNKKIKKRLKIQIFQNYMQKVMFPFQVTLMWVDWWDG